MPRILRPYVSDPSMDPDGLSAEDSDWPTHTVDLLDRPERPNVRRPLASGVRVA